MSYIIFADSFGSKVVSDKSLFPDNSTVVSFSGCDLLEYILLITKGSLLSENRAFSRGNLILQAGGRQYYGKQNPIAFVSIDSDAKPKGAVWKR